MSSLLGNASAARELELIRRVSRAMREGAVEMADAVTAARAAGASWQAIADAVGPAPHRPGGSSATAIRRFYDRAAWTRKAW